MADVDETTRIERALTALDAANAEDPNVVTVGGRRVPKERAHADRVSEWVRRLRSDASPALTIAARAHHVRRWEIPRDRYPEGRAGYLRWRATLQRHHAEVTAGILRSVGLGDELIERVSDIVRKRGLGRDPEVQVFEDALCLTFLEIQLGTFAAGRDAARVQSILTATLRKMSPEARREAARIEIAEEARAALADAIRAFEQGDR